MRLPKSKLDSNSERIAKFAIGIALPIRISILKILLINKSWVTTEAFTTLELTIVTRDRHLRSLIDLGLVMDEHRKGIIYYKINDDTFGQMVDDCLVFWQDNRQNLKR